MNESAILSGFYFTDADGATLTKVTNVSLAIINDDASITLTEDNPQEFNEKISNPDIKPCFFFTVLVDLNVMYIITDLRLWAPAWISHRGMYLYTTDWADRYEDAISRLTVNDYQALRIKLKDTYGDNYFS